MVRRTERNDVKRRRGHAEPTRARGTGGRAGACVLAPSSIGTLHNNGKHLHRMALNAPADLVSTSFFVILSSVSPFPTIPPVVPMLGGISPKCHT